MSKMHLPKEIEGRINNLPITEITENHRSGDRVYQVGEDYILKVSDIGDRLLREKEANDFLKGKLPVSETVAYVQDGEWFYYLKTCVKGVPLTEEVYLKNPALLAKLLAAANRMVHEVGTAGCTLNNLDSEGEVFIHGDMCLPNILAIGDKVTGFIDTEACGLGDIWMDYAWCIWSYEYNLGTKEYTPLLLKELGITFDREKFEIYTAMDE
jgi:aminoglycoside phosphotransferase